MVISVVSELDFDDLKKGAWSGAVDTLRIVEEHGLQDELMELLEDAFCSTIPTNTEINDFLWFEDEYIFETLGIDTEEED